MGEPKRIRASRVVTFDIDLPKGEVATISPVFDVHAEGKRCAYDKLKAELEARAGENHYAFLGGDVLDMITPRDLMRFQPSVQSESLHGRDDWADAAVEVASERISSIDGVKILGVGVGNHEHQYTKRHGFDVTSALAHRLKCARLGMSGVIRLRIKQPDQDRSKCEVFTIVWHHGAWGGEVINGFGRAWRYFNVFRDWHVALFGHNHWTKVEPERRWRISPTGKLVEVPVYLAACGTFSDGYDPVEAFDIDYSDLKGYAPSQPAMCPWVKVRHVRSGSRLDYGMGVGLYE